VSVGAAAAAWGATGSVGEAQPSSAGEIEACAVLWRALEEVMDPEIPISLVDLGLIYDIRHRGGLAEVDLTFTATACPCMAFIRQDIEERLLCEQGVDEVRINEVWNPPWTKARITARGREQLKLLGVSL
jgi:metal-sulfur cluster biosynthetic enzyme